MSGIFTRPKLIDHNISSVIYELEIFQAKIFKIQEAHSISCLIFSKKTSYLK